ncbi:MAG: EscU/YscU/HrcU family type III secretion system export apparatus switch protein [Myxococcales bacterium]|nr:EscU/YscU/HrcU family type III secretion system export apparatus switch protein [Myxococcota bacterium]MDW8283356.1 EscU/YscU/HrcU family type III secretion system export apparatus switch protein [Myxococcales bacterium]
MIDESVDQDEKTEEATPQRRDQARERGQVARSRDLVSAMTLLVGVAALGLLSQSMVRALGQMGASTFGSLHRSGDALALCLSGAHGLLVSVAPFLGATMAAALVATLMQTGMPQRSWVRIDLGRLNPLPRLGQMFSPGLAGWELLKTGLKLGAVGLAAWQVLQPTWDELGSRGALPPAALLARMLELSRSLLLRLGLLLLALAVLDYIISRWRTERALRMTRREVREELRHSEGNPQVKRRLRRKARELLKRRLAVEVPKSDVVVVNPTHYAVALSYRPGAMRAPRVLAKGVDHIAMRIRALARSAGVPVVSNPPLARDLHRRVRVGGEIPTDLYRAVAEVLAFVYRIRQRTLGEARS